VVHRYFLAVNHLNRPGSASTLSHLDSPNCPCRRQLRSVRLVDHQGGHYVASARLRALRPLLVDSEHVTVLALFDAGPSWIETANGRRTHYTGARESVQQSFHLSMTRGSWQISGIDLIR
jgi:hypothetical protein